MAYQELTQYNSPNYTPVSQVAAFYGMIRFIEGVTYHWWSDPKLRPLFLSIINYLCRPNGNTSAHVVGEAGRIAWIVDAVHAAWHAGHARGNAQTIGYECNPRLSDGDYETMGEFHYDMEKAYGRRLSIYVHKEWSATSCSPIDKGRIRAIADRYHRGVPQVNENQIRTLFMEILGRDVDASGLQHYLKQAGNGWTIDQIRNDIYNSQEAQKRRAELARQAEEAKKPEWVKNMLDIEDLKLLVSPAQGLRVVDFRTMQPRGDVIPRGTAIDIVAETTVQGKKYFVSSYSFKNSMPFGILAEELVKPAAPEKDKPEWMKNLKDIEDKDFWTRSETPVINLEAGKEAARYEVNKKVRVTHTTTFGGTDFMVLDGGSLAIDKLYLDDKPIKNPYDDLTARVSALEKIVNTIVAFLTNLFKGFKK